MAQDSELVRLEKFVSKVLDSYKELKAENARLSADLKDRNETIASLEEKLEVNASERSDISDRVTKLIEQIEELETDLEDFSDESPSSAGETSRQGNLF